MPEIRFTEEDQQIIDRGFQEIDRRFDSKFELLGRRLDEDELDLIKAYMRDRFRREALVFLGLESLYGALLASDVGGDRKTFISGGMAAAVEAEMSADQVGLFDRAEDENDVFYQKLELTPHELKRRDQIKEEVYHRYGLEVGAPVRPARTPEEKLRGVDLMVVGNEVQTAIEEAGLGYPNDDLNNGVFSFSDELIDWVQEQLDESKSA